MPYYFSFIYGKQATRLGYPFFCKVAAIVCLSSIDRPAKEPCNQQHWHVLTRRASRLRLFPVQVTILGSRLAFSCLLSGALWRENLLTTIASDLLQ